MDSKTNTTQSNSGLEDMEPKKEGRVGAIIGSIIIILIIIVGGIYFFNSVSDRMNKAGEVAPAVDSATLELQVQSDSNEVDSIEVDLQNTDLDGLDKELEDIDKEFEGL